MSRLFDHRFFCFVSFEATRSLGTAIFFASSMRFLAVVYWTHSDGEDYFHGYALDVGWTLRVLRQQFCRGTYPSFLEIKD